MILVRTLAFFIGLYLVGFTLTSAIRTFVLPRAANTLLTRWTFQWMWKLYRFRLRSNHDYQERHRLLALFTPITLIMLPAIWMAFVLVGFGLMYWGIGVANLYDAFALSGSSALTLGFSPVQNLPQTILAFSEAAIGVGLIALSVAYLPTMYAAFSRRETLVSKMVVRLGTPPSGLGMILRLHSVNRFDILEEMWIVFEDWFVHVEETHTSLAPLNFFRSSQADHSWLTTAGTVLDGTALFLAAIDIPASAQAHICMRAGYVALRHIGDFFKIPYNPNPQPSDDVSVSRLQFEHALDQLNANHVPLKPDRDQAWRDYAGWRVNYDVVLRQLVVIINVPPAPWINDIE